ncbi:hypothetical protein QQS21_005194 [Conoideocrella luteorostrata]|uniref:Asl1-like glycosyl hydrolase catalytic domain-containing protein n=1 Tax=Conoideocrella luteorostrata TaxID=1105319 RepID=A0AAJ0CPY7_9HYPO|nr:hypothetical protein QQS21_005194 [Conoideocrella luteorostrata]
MYTNKIAALAGAVAIIDQAAALNIHRHEQKLQKKQDAVVWETVVETVWVTEGAPAPKSTVFADNAGTVTSVVVVPTQQPKIEPPPVALPTVEKPPAPAPTSLVTSVKPATPTSTVASNNGGSSGTGFSGKRGLAYNEPTLANLVGSSCKSGVCGWAYNWGQTPGALDSKYSFVPMLWGAKGFDTWAASADKAISNGAKALFSFNEPDNKGQANMQPSDAATLHVKHMNSYSGKALIGAPSVSNSNLQGEGLEWLQSWVQECEGKGCKYDFCNVHWYSPVSAIDTLFDHIEKAHKICGGKPVWLTEFAPVEANDAQTADFLSKAIPRLESLDYLHAYSYFMVSAEPNRLLSSLSSLSAVGNKYVSI